MLRKRRVDRHQGWQSEFAMEARHMALTVTSVIPIFRIFDVAKAKEFYAGFLGFTVDWEHQRVVCPQGKQSLSWSPLMDRNNRPVFKVNFSRSDCTACPVRSRCTRSKLPAERSLLRMPQPQYEALNQARAIHASPQGQQRYKRRAGIEGTLSQGVRAFGLRHRRYRGLAKTHLQTIAIAAAINLERLVNWLHEVPRAKTRVTRFAALAAD